MWVSPFRYLRIYGYLLLPAAFRSLSRLSSALSAKASTLRSYQLNLFDLASGFRFTGRSPVPIHSVGRAGYRFFLCVYKVFFVTYLYVTLGCLVISFDIS